MPQWTLLGLLQGKQTAPWPLAEGTDGQEGFLGMPRYKPELVQRRLQSMRRYLPDQGDHHARAPDSGGRLDVDYGRCVVCQLCTEACPTGAMSPSSDWAFGVRVRDDLIWKARRRQHARRRRANAPRIPAQPARPPRRRRLVQRLRIRAAGAEQSVLQPAPPRHLLHRVAALCRPSVGDRAGDERHARPAARHLRSDGGAALGACRRHVRRVRRHRRGRLCLGSRTRWRDPGRCLSARLPTQPRRNHPGAADVSRPRAAAGQGRPACRMSF